MKSWHTGKDSGAGRDWRQKKGMTEDEMAGWHHGLDGQECEWTLGVGDGQGGLVCCCSWGRKYSDRTEQLNWIEFIFNIWYLQVDLAHQATLSMEFSRQNIGIVSHSLLYGIFQTQGSKLSPAFHVDSSLVWATRENLDTWDVFKYFQYGFFSLLK